MAAEIVTIPCLTDNYAYLVRPEGGDVCALVDAPEAAPIEAALAERGWTLAAVLITHHHADHAQGLAALREGRQLTVVGPAAEAGKMPPLDAAVRGGDDGGAGLFAAEVLEVPGHTSGHIAYHLSESGVVFTADSLMALGCGRLFEGTPAQMWESLGRLAALPEDTLVCSGHEYTAANARFALSVEPENAALRARAEAVEAARARNKPTVPSRLSEERATNPFLRAGTPQMKAALEMEGADDVEVFARLRRMKDDF